MLVLLTGCGDSSDPGDSLDAGTPAVGRIDVTESTMLGHPPRENGAVSARFTTSGLPLWQVEDMREASCRLMRYQVGNCPDCWDGVCVKPDECRPFPTYVSVDDLSISGLKIPMGFRYDEYAGYRADRPLPPNLFDAGDSVMVSATGGDMPAFSASASAVAGLDANIPADQEGTVLLRDGADFQLSWQPVAGDHRIRLVLNSATTGHGLPVEGYIECDVADTGNLVVPRALVEAFPFASTSPICVGVDCPPSFLTRYSRSTTGAGQGVELLVESRVEFWLRHVTE